MSGLSFIRFRGLGFRVWGLRFRMRRNEQGAKYKPEHETSNPEPLGCAKEPTKYTKPLFNLKTPKP